MAFQLISEGGKKQHEKELSLVRHLSTFRSIVFVRLGSCRTLYLGTERVRRLAMQVNILGGFVLFFTFSQVVR